eukprot:555674-Pyramimonas_sp.AAC.1
MPNGSLTLAMERPPDETSMNSMSPGHRVPARVESFTVATLGHFSVDLQSVRALLIKDHSGLRCYCMETTLNWTTIWRTILTSSTRPFP